MHDSIQNAVRVTQSLIYPSFVIFVNFCLTSFSNQPLAAENEFVKHPKSGLFVFLSALRASVVKNLSVFSSEFSNSHQPRS